MQLLGSGRPTSCAHCLQREGAQASTRPDASVPPALSEAISLTHPNPGTWAQVGSEVLLPRVVALSCRSTHLEGRRGWVWVWVWEGRRGSTWKEYTKEEGVGTGRPTRSCRLPVGALCMVMGDPPYRRVALLARAAHGRVPHVHLAGAVLVPRTQVLV